MRHLSRALASLGHSVTVFSGPPYPQLSGGVELVALPSLDLYRPEDPFRRARPMRGPVDWLEFGMMCGAAFPEPLTFSLRARSALAARPGEFDVVHDNQGLGYGLLGISRRLPVVATVHHPVAVDRRLELAATPSWTRRTAIRRWYGFTRMQGRVARRLPRLLTVSESARDLIATEMGVEPERVAVIPNGVDADTFQRPAGSRPLPGRIMTTASADVPLKGLVHLLEAVARIRLERPVTLLVLGRPRAGGPALAAVERLGLRGCVEFRSGLTEADIVAEYARAEVAVVPSLYEGFSLPAAEAMACEVPLVCTTAGALPEVAGPHGEAALHVAPGDGPALARAIIRLLDAPALRMRLGAAGRRRVLERLSWARTAAATADLYGSVLEPC